MSPRWLLLALCLILAAAAPLPKKPIDKRWFATWRLDRSRSQLVGSSITISRTASGYHFDFGAVAFDVGDDGRDYPTVPTRTTSIRPVGDRAWDRIHKVNGLEVDRSRLTLSPSGTELSIDTVASDDTGQVHRSHEVLRREGGGDGLSGRWRSADAGINVSPVIVVSDAGQGRIRFAYPADGQSYVSLLDGAPSDIEGPRAVPGVQRVIRLVRPGEIEWMELVRGKPYTVGSDLLGGNGSLLTETSWPAADRTERQVAVYERRWAT